MPADQEADRRRDGRRQVAPDDVAHAEDVDDVAHVRLAEVLQVVGAEQPPWLDRGTVTGGQPADVPHVHDAVEVDPPVGHSLVGTAVLAHRVIVGGSDVDDLTRPRRLGAVRDRLELDRGLPLVRHVRTEPAERGDGVEQPAHARRPR